MLGLERSFRSLTLSPFASILAQARRQARRHLEVGGTVPANGRVVEEPIEQDFELPRDVDPLVVALAIDAKLRHGQKASPGIGDDPMQLLERRAGGRVVVAGHHLLRLGDGNFAKGKRFMHGLVAKLRQH
jgi:hypothetical protein